MKKTIILASALALLSLVSCKKERYDAPEQFGTLSFAEFSVVSDDAVETKATSPASGSYTVLIYDSSDNLVKKTTYADVKANSDKISLPAGNYTLDVRSREEEVPAAEFEDPIYGVEKAFSITAGQTTTIGSLTCTLLQVKVTVSYSDEFLKDITGDGVASVEVTQGSPLSYSLSYNNGTPSFDESAGYFAINNGANTTMTVTFKGNVEGKSQTMSKSFKNIQAKQWRQIKFIKKVIADGNATFDITINDLVGDELLNEDLTGSNVILKDDPLAPKGDGGIAFDFDYDAGCDREFTSFDNVEMPQTSERTVCLKLKGTVPNGVKKFVVHIASTNDSFVSAVTAAKALDLDLINPLPDNMLIFQVVPFPYGEQLSGQTSLAFDMSAAQSAITIYQGRHTFTLDITDNKGCRNQIPLVMVVK